MGYWFQIIKYKQMECYCDVCDNTIKKNPEENLFKV